MCSTENKTEMPEILQSGAKTEGFPCPVCGRYSFQRPGDYEICPVCGWENDRVQTEDPDFAGGANDVSLNEAIQLYKDQEF